jgi:tetratricopeptide (TPR) repeat protein
MKKLLVLLLMVAVTGLVFAQEEGLSEGLQAKNDGNNAFREKNYLEAIKQWEKYLKSGEEGVADDFNTKNLYEMSFKLVADGYMGEKAFDKAFTYYQKYLSFDNPDSQDDGAVFFNYGFAAKELNKNDIALSMFQKCIELKYRDDFATVLIADMYRKADDDEAMKKVLLEGLEKYPNSRHRTNMVKMLIVPMLREAAEPFNEANAMAKKAAEGGNAESYVQYMEQAVVKFEQAIPLLENVLKIDPQNQSATTYLDACKDNIKRFEEYKASIKK